MGQGRDAVTKNSDAPKVKGAPHPDFPNVTGLLPEPKRLWLEALRSGRFQQGHTMLAVDRGDGMQFCCLGVLCEVAIEAGLDLPRTERAPAFGVEKRSLAYGGCTVMPPEEVNQCERLVDKELAYLNDDEGWTFEQIANAIEESL
jgi:hypothetical protein